MQTNGQNYKPVTNMLTHAVTHWFYCIYCRATIEWVSNVSPEMAVRISAVLGGSAESWLTLQESYDLWKARQVVHTKDLRRIDFSKVA